ncbi:MAG: UDP-N-acetylglucosamine--N-acetylmuramyl-(pentapeptide) pyrophosphoryl-undecaprenol N-acetylglucosamine transferase [Alphaproteobacteria bacterium]
MKKKLYILAAGGTGGHVFPAFSLCEELIKIQDAKVYLITDQRGIAFCKKHNFHKIVTLQIPKPSKGRFVQIIGILWKMWFCFKFFRKVKPSVVIGFGGYPTIPPVLTAQLLSIPTILHEQNALLGRANQLLARKASFIATSFPCTIAKTPTPVVLTGNFVRTSISDLKDHTYSISDDFFQLLILGGSQGTQLFSMVVPNALKLLPQNIKDKLIIYHQCREEDINNTQKLYAASHYKSVTIKPFFCNIDEIYKGTNLVLSRAGASTLAELSIIGVPAVLIPLKSSLYGDQKANASFYKEKGAAWVIEEDDFSADNFLKHISHLINNHQLLIDASLNMRRLSSPYAGQKFVQCLGEVQNL